jgi:twitching motility protein PilT
LVKDLTNEKKQKELEEVGSTDFALPYRDIAVFRGSAFRQQGHVSLVLRLLPNELFSFHQLGLPDMLLEEIMRPRGLFLVTGPTGSGKSSTLASLINYVNENASKHIITVEDPIEFVHRSKKCVINQRCVGEDVPSFAEALKRALRQDPDIILVGEMRDLETIQTAIRAAETGHLVMGTLHTRSASETVHRIVDAFPADQQAMIRTQLASSLNMVLCQNLVKKIGGGRVLASEIMKVSHGMRQMIRDNRIHQIPSAMETNRGEGNRLLDTHLCDLYLKGVIKWDEAMDKATDPSTIKARLTEAKNSVEYWIGMIQTQQMALETALQQCPDAKALRAALAAQAAAAGGSAKR